MIIQLLLVSLLGMGFGCYADQTVSSQPENKNQVTVTSGQRRKEKKRKRKEKKEAENKTAKKRTAFVLMSYEELKEGKIKHLMAKDYEGALKFLEKMIPLCSDLNELHDIMLEYADLLKQTDHLEKASTMFHEFVKMYPSSKKTEYAYFQAIECNFKEINDPDRDQTKTKNTIELANAFLERAIFTTYASQVKEIRRKCYEQLLESELLVFNFYVSRGRTKSAEKRLENMRKTFMAELPTAEPHILTTEWHFAQQQKNSQLAEQKRTELIQKFPDFTITQKDIQNSQPKRLMVNRF